MLIKVSAYYLAKNDKNKFRIHIYTLHQKDPDQAAFANNPGTEHYYVAMSRGKINKTLDNKYNFENITYHEVTHRYDKTTNVKFIGEIEAIYQQSMHSSWLNVSSDFISSQADYAVDMLQKAIDNKIPGLNIQEQLSKINEAFFGYGSFQYNTETNKVEGNITHNLNEVIIYGKKR